MKKAWKWIAGAIALALLIVGAYFLYNYLKEGYEIEGPQGNEYSSSSIYAAPDFTVYDISGNKVKLSDLKGKPVVLNFWATWCYYCTEEMPDFQSMYEKYDGEVTFMMINVTDGERETSSAAREFITENGYTFPVYFDTELEATYQYGASSLPLTYFIDENGDMVARSIGLTTAEKLEKGIEMIIE